MKKTETRVEAFFKSEYQKLVNFVQKNMEQRFADATPEDIVQDVALNLLDKLNVDAQIENLAAYIYRSLRNKIVDTQKKKRTIVLMDTFEKKEAESQLIHDQLNEPEEPNRLMDYEPQHLLAAIEMLSDEEKYLINGTQFQGKSFQELSIELKTPIGTLLSRKHRAQAKLGKILEANRLN